MGMQIELSEMSMQGESCCEYAERVVCCEYVERVV